MHANSVLSKRINNYKKALAHLSQCFYFASVCDPYYYRCSIWLNSGSIKIIRIALVTLQMLEKSLSGGYFRLTARVNEVERNRQTNQRTDATGRQTDCFIT